MRVDAMDFRYAARLVPRRRVASARPNIVDRAANQANLEELVVTDNVSDCHSRSSAAIKRRSRRTRRIAHARLKRMRLVQSRFATALNLHRAKLKLRNVVSKLINLSFQIFSEV